MDNILTNQNKFYVRYYISFCGKQRIKWCINMTPDLTRKQKNVQPILNLFKYINQFNQSKINN